MHKTQLCLSFVDNMLFTAVLVDIKIEWKVQISQTSLPVVPTLPP